MKLTRTLVIGVLGAILAVGIERIAGWVAGRDADLCRLAGVVLTGNASTTSMLLGCAAQLVVAMISACVYAVLFEWATRRAGALIGFVIGLGHVIVAGLVVGFMPGERLMNAGIMPPGAFMEYRGVIVLVGFLVAHLAFGTFVGAAYGATVHAASPAAPRWREVEG
jgi:hypothetical protein